MKVIILAGGSGVRLWPLSRDLYPKSLLNLYDGKSLIQNVFKLALSLVDEKDVLVVTNARLLNDTKSHLNKLCKNPIILAEPMSKNTASATALALHYLRNKKDETVVILPVDFSIKKNNALKEAVEQAQYAVKKGYITAIGVKPAYPDNGFGYIKPWQTDKNSNIVPVAKFVEKPDKKTAEEFIKSKNFYWNTGIYISKLSVLFNEIQKYAPEVCEGFSKEMFTAERTVDYRYYADLSELSIDCAVMEKTDKLAFVELKTKWKDYGSWQEIYNNSEKNSVKNVLQGNVITDNVSNSMIYSSKELVTAACIKDTTVIDTEDALFVCDKNQLPYMYKLVQKVKENYDETTQIRKTVIRPWGFYTCLNKGKGWLTKIITVYAEHKLSLQSHSKRSEHWVILEGTATVILEDNTFTLNEGTSINIPVNKKHSLQNKTKNPLKILEVQKGEYIGEDDIIRYEDIYGRI